MKIAVLGQGAMGSRMAARLATAGHAVTVWNRSPKAPPPGAAAAESIPAAVAEADLVLGMLRDDAASARVWGDAMPAMRRDALGIESSTLGVAQVRRLHRAAAEAGLRFLEAPVVGSRPQAEAGQLIFLAGGVAPVVEAARPFLAAMGAAVHHLGGPGAGALAKLVVNAMFAVQVAALAELTAMISAQGEDPARMLAVLAQTPVASPAATNAGAAMLARAFAPAFPIELVAKDLALVQDSAAGQPLPVSDAAATAYAAAARNGLGGLNITGILRAYLPD